MRTAKSIERAFDDELAKRGWPALSRFRPYAEMAMGPARDSPPGMQGHIYESLIEKVQIACYMAVQHQAGRRSRRTAA